MRVCEKYRRDSAFSAAHDQCVGACERAVGQPLTLVDLMMMPNQRPSRCANHVPWNTPQPLCAVRAERMGGVGGRRALQVRDVPARDPESGGRRRGGEGHRNDRPHAGNAPRRTALLPDRSPLERMRA